MEEEYGKCPNCGSDAQISDMGKECGTVCCKNCYEELRQQSLQDN